MRAEITLTLFLEVEATADRGDPSVGINPGWEIDYIETIFTDKTRLHTLDDLKAFLINEYYEDIVDQLEA